MTRKTFIVLVEVDAEDDKMPDQYDLATAVSGVLKNESGDSFFWGDPTVFVSLSDLQANMNDGLCPDLAV